MTEIDSQEVNKPVPKKRGRPRKIVGGITLSNDLKQRAKELLQIRNEARGILPSPPKVKKPKSIPARPVVLCARCKTYIKKYVHYVLPAPNIPFCSFNCLSHSALREVMRDEWDTNHPAPALPVIIPPVPIGEVDSA